MDSLPQTDYALPGPESLLPDISASYLPGEPMALDHTSRDMADRAAHRANLLVVIEDQATLSPSLRPICEYLGLILRPAASSAELRDVLEDYRPLAIISPFETEFMDGGHILRTIAAQDPALPVMLLTDQDPVFQGAIEAMVEVFGLPNIRVPTQDPSTGDLMDFLAHAARHTRTRRPRTPLNGDGFD